MPPQKEMVRSVTCVTVLGPVERLCNVTTPWLAIRADIDDAHLSRPGVVAMRYARAPLPSVNPETGGIGRRYVNYRR